MNRQQKAAVIAQLQDRVAQSSATFVVGYRGLTVSQLHTLRTDLRKVGGEFKVAKARLIKKAIAQIDNNKAFDGYQEYLHDQIGIVFTDKEAPAVAKALHEFSKNNPLTIVAGTLDADLLNKDAVVRIASLPSREQLLAKLCGTLQASAAQLARVLNAIATKPATVE